MIKIYDNELEDQKILFTYLSKFYGQNKAKELMVSNAKNLWGKNGLAYALGKRSIEFFCLYFLQDTFRVKPDNQNRELAPVHYEMWREAEELFIYDKYDKLCAILPRGTAKTTIFDFSISVYLHAYGISPYTLVAGKTEQDAIEFIGMTRQAFEENQYIIKAFGQLIDTRRFTVNKLELELTNKTKIQAISSASSMRGKKYGNHRPFCIIADDYQSKSDIITQEARDKKYRTWMDDAKFAGDKSVIRNGKKIKMATKFIVLGTILHRDCFMSRLLKDKDYKHILKKAVLVDDVDKLFNDDPYWSEFKKLYFDSKLTDSVAYAKEYYYQNQGKMQYPVLWPDKWNCLSLAIDYYNDSISFKQELQNDASKIGDKWFKSNRTQSKENIEAKHFTKTMLCVDCASTDTKKSDYFAFIVGSLADNDFKYVRRGELLKLDARTEFEKYIRHVLDLLKEFPDCNTIYIEKNTFSGVDAGRIEKEIQNDPELSKRNIKIINEMQRQNKDQKISTVVDSVNNGRIIFCSERVQPEALEQLMNFSGQETTLHDDFVDCLSEFSNRIDQVEEPIHKLEFLDKRLLF